MATKSQLIAIACYLTNRRESKKHGGYLIYEEPGKIQISYDTYFPNVDVYVWVDGKKQLAALISGHGSTQEYHGGAWEAYARDVLYPRALEAKAESERKKQEREENERRERSRRLNDSSTFA